MDDKMMQVSESAKERLVEDLVHDGWATSAAWAAADDQDNWTEMADGSIQPIVIASSDQYDD